MQKNVETGTPFCRRCDVFQHLGQFSPRCFSFIDFQSSLLQTGKTSACATARSAYAIFRHFGQFLPLLL